VLASTHHHTWFLPCFPLRSKHLKTLSSIWFFPSQKPLQSSSPINFFLLHQPDRRHVCELGKLAARWDHAAIAKTVALGEARRSSPSTSAQSQQPEPQERRQARRLAVPLPSSPRAIFFLSGVMIVPGPFLLATRPRVSNAFDPACFPYSFFPSR
jgi:hypothetical protein